MRVWHVGFVEALLCFVTCIHAAQSQSDGMLIRAGLLADIVYSQSTVPTINGNRLFTLQPSKDRSLGMMQGHIDVTGESTAISWRLALQEGWFAAANYTGDDYAWRFLQEASLDVRIRERLTIRGGVMPSHIGYESMIARDNLTLSRSFTADNTPYFETGVSGTYAADDELSISLLLLNGWQRIVDNNDDLALGTALKWKPDSSIVLSWNTFVGNDQPRAKPSLTRFHNNIWCEWSLTEELMLVGLFDVDLQQKTSSGASTQWYAALVSRFFLTPSLRLAGRIEHYSDPDGIIVQPTIGRAFAATAGSINADYDLTESIMLRAECRRIAYNDLFLNANTNNAQSSETYFTLSISTRLSTGPL